MVHRHQEGRDHTLHVWDVRDDHRQHGVLRSVIPVGAANDD